jgi:hypothetical protein
VPLGHLFPKQPVSKIERIVKDIRYHDATVPTCKVMEIKVTPGRRWPIAALFPPQPNQVLEPGQYFGFDVTLENLIFPEVVLFPNCH